MIIPDLAKEKAGQPPGEIVTHETFASATNSRIRGGGVTG